MGVKQKRKQYPDMAEKLAKGIRRGMCCWRRVTAKAEALKRMGSGARWCQATLTGQGQETNESRFR